MKELLRRYKFHWSEERYRFSAPLAIFAFFLSIAANFYATLYATEEASNPVTDIILSNVRVFDVDALFVYGTLILIVFVVLLCLSHPKRLPLMLHSLSLFYFTRAIFVTLTHLGPFPGRVVLDIGAFTAKFLGGADLFFSAHTGVPFLLALMFWNHKKLRYIFLVWSAFFAIIVLLGHLHYSIDVLSAFFITYTIYHIALWLFPKEYALFHAEDSENSASVVANKIA
ncbi:MAG: phosphatase PAP2-related protein [bacterium]|nr:phosphatase PAP2-related protein [bacterium]